MENRNGGRHVFFFHKLKQNNGAKDLFDPNNMLSNDARAQTMRNMSRKFKAKYIHLNAGIRLKLPCIPPVNTVPHGGQIAQYHMVVTQNSTTWWPDSTVPHGGQIAQYHMVAR